MTTSCEFNVGNIVFGGPPKVGGVTLLHCNFWQTIDYYTLLQRDTSVDVWWGVVDMMFGEELLVFSDELLMFGEELLVFGEELLMFG